MSEQPPVGDNPQWKEPCDFCGEIVAEWVTPDWTTKTVCLKCEPIHEPESFKANPPAVHGEGELPIRSWPYPDSSTLAGKIAFRLHEVSTIRHALFTPNDVPRLFAPFIQEVLDKESADKDALIRGLATKWRDEANAKERSSSIHKGESRHKKSELQKAREMILRKCADEIEAALRQAEQGGGE